MQIRLSYKNPCWWLVAMLEGAPVPALTKLAGLAGPPGQSRAMCNEAETPLSPTSGRPQQPGPGPVAPSRGQNPSHPQSGPKVGPDPAFQASSGKDPKDLGNRKPAGKWRG